MIEKCAKVWLGGRTGVTAPIHVSQYDTAWRFLLTVYDGDSIFVGSGDELAVLEGHKPDGTAFVVDGDFADGVATFDCPLTMTAATGAVSAELRLINDGGAVGTANFDIIVERAPLSGYYASGEDFSAVAQLIDKIVARTPDAAADWLEDHITNPSNPPIDTSLSVSNAAADAKTVGEKLTALGTPIATSHVAATAIPQNADMHTYTTPGNYRVTTANAATLVNAPEAVGARVIVLTRTASTTVTQIWISHNGIFWCSLLNNTWTDWVKLVDAAALDTILSNSTLRTYTDRVTASFASSKGWTTISDMPVNMIYQLGNDLPDTFDLCYNDSYSTLIILQANNRLSSSTWGRYYIQVYENTMAIKLGANDWKVTASVADISTAISTLESISVQTSDSRVSAADATAEGWTSVVDMPVNRIYQLDNDLPSTFGLAVAGSYATLIILQANNGSSLSTWNKIYVQTVGQSLYVRLGTGRWRTLNANLDTDCAAFTGLILKNMTDTIKVGLYGASVVAGQGVTGYNPFTDQGGTYVDLSEYGYSHGGFYKYTGFDSWGAKFASYLTTNYPNITVENWGIPGASPSSLYTYWTATDTPINTDVDIAIIVAGANSTQTSESTLVSTLRNMADFFLDKGVTPIFLSRTPAFYTGSILLNAAQATQVSKRALQGYAPYVYTFSEVIDYCEAEGIAVKYDATAEKNFLTSDNLHPSNTGHDVIFKCVRKLLKV